MSSSSLTYYPLESTSGINPGKIVLYLGPVFSGKTTRLFQKFSKYDHLPLSAIMVKPSPSPKIEDQIISHDGQIQKAISCSNLKEQISQLIQYDIIGIDDGHLFPDLVEVCEDLEEKGKIIYVTALNGNEKMQPYENISRLFSRIEKIKLFHAFCYFCKETAKFSIKTEQGMKPICRICHEKYKNGFAHIKNVKEKNKENERKYFYAEVKREGLEEIIEMELDEELKIRQRKNEIIYGNGVMNGTEELMVNEP